MVQKGDEQHYTGTGDGQCVGVKKNGERCTNGVNGSNKYCGTHERASDVTNAPETDDQDWFKCPQCGWQRVDYERGMGGPPFCSHCSCELPTSAPKWSEINTNGDSTEEYPENIMDAYGSPLLNNDNTKPVSAKIEANDSRLIYVHENDLPLSIFDHFRYIGGKNSRKPSDEPFSPEYGKVTEVVNDGNSEIYVVQDGSPSRVDALPPAEEGGANSNAK